MDEFDAAYEVLDETIKEFAAFLGSRDSVSETDTRCKLIDRILVDVCGWPEGEISREDHVDSGFTDYVLSPHGHPFVCVEAKREGIAFTLPEHRKQTLYALNGGLLTEDSIKAAVQQVQQYCVDQGVPFAIATNGNAWIIFKAVRTDMPWKKGRARVFNSLDEIRADFTDFWNLLSYEALCNGSLADTFDSSLRSERELHRVIDRLHNANLPLQRNRLNVDLQPIIRLIFEDIAEQDSLDILESCYIHTGSLNNVATDIDHVLTEAIPKFLIDEGIQPLTPPSHRRSFERILKGIVNETRGGLFLLLGGIGCGKSTFLKRYQKTVGKRVLDERAVWFHIDFLKAPTDVTQMEAFVWSEILDDLRRRYSELQPERRKHLHAIFEPEIDALRSTVLQGARPGTSRFDSTVGPYLARWQEELVKYVPRLVQNTCIQAARVPLLFVDNVDQLASQYQAQIFLLAQRVTRVMSCITIVALREESYFSTSVRKAFTAYTSRRFHIAPPLIRRLLGSRLDYSIAYLEGARTSDLDSPDAYRIDEVCDFLRVVQFAILNNRKIGRFIKAICHGNMRLALEMFGLFVTSGATDVDKMIRIFNRDGLYHIAEHEFVKAIMLGDRAYYKEEESAVANLFNVGSEKNASHFTAWRILRLLNSRLGESTPEGRGYVEISNISYDFEQVMQNAQDVIATLNRLVQRNLVELNSRATDEIADASHCRITSGGWYYIKYLSHSFAYLDLVLQDTPINSQELVNRLKDSVWRVNNRLDAPEDQLERVRARFERVEEFLGYLHSEEEAEREHFSLDVHSSPLSEPIVPAILESFENERKWIDRRLRENREKYADEVGADSDDAEELLFGMNESDDAPT